ncbi:acyl-CoA N-acyltransferase [Aspergillus steynii IBT 23096]|uniref:Acyl-CoA N-acyltransferase n=1 Tax=Aspergillus steynii IBT 23096 TaxID=1392250 RepID=A0A2I2GAK4_9EURO|nr:acyl-CoA N-acyltransferase [Aspergillus steynii IBT 23096]PLB49911.1 acyl-CoA N-acyltransferase [Aspergillus steynii IBT 23096]
MSITLTTLKPENYASWASLWKQFITHCEAELPQSQYEDTFKRIVEPDGNLQAHVLVNDTGAVVGLAHYFFHQSVWNPHHVCYLSDLFVDSSLRGKGCGRTLIEATAKSAEEKGCRRLYWAAYHTNTPARRMYDTVADAKCEFVEYRMPLNTEKGH